MLVTDAEEVPLANGWAWRGRVRSNRLAGGVFPLELAVEGLAEPPWSLVGDSLLAALLLPAMAFREPLVLDAPVSQRLLERVPDISAIYRAWADVEPIVVEAPSVRRAQGNAGSALFFSGGVDAFYSLLKARDRGTTSHPFSHLVFLNGFDIPLGNFSLGPALASARRVAEDVGAELVVVSTNLRSLAEPFIDWDLYHGAVLAALGLLLGTTVSRCVIAASYPYQFLRPLGSHPVLDPLWSTEAVEFVHDGCEANRGEKIVYIADSPLAQRELRVCVQSINGFEVFNCGRCRKCLATMLTLRLRGKLDAMRTFPPLNPERMEELQLKQIESLGHLLSSSDDRDLVGALRALRRRKRWLERRTNWARRTRLRMARRWQGGRRGDRERHPVVQLQWDPLYRPNREPTDSNVALNAFLHRPASLIPALSFDHPGRRS